MSIVGFNRNLACEPFVARVAETKAFGAGDRQFKVHTAKTTLVPLKVVYGLEDQSIYPGDLVYVKQEGSVWSKEIDVELGDGQFKKVVIVSTDQIVLVQRAIKVAAERP